MALTTFLCVFPAICNFEAGCLEVGNLDTLVVIDSEQPVAEMTIGDGPTLQTDWSLFEDGNERVFTVVLFREAPFPTLLTIEANTGDAALTYHANPRNPLPIQSAIGTCEEAT